MTKTAKTITYAAGIFTAFWLIIAFLITSVEAVAYWTPGYYEKEYTKYQVLNDLPEMTMDDLLDVTDQMMAFLRGKREDLHVYTTMGGEYREFFNDREIAHMEDVQGLFIGGLWLRRIGIRYFTWLIRLFTGTTITDPTSGMRMVNREVIHYFAEEYPKDYPEPETAVVILKKGWKVKEIPVEMKERQAGTSSISMKRSVYYMIKVSLACFMAAMAK